MSPARFEFRGVVKEYPGIRALDDVSLAVAPGEAIGLVGHNGAGKSTLSKIAVGLEQPDRGSLAIDGEEVTIGSAQEATRLGVGLVPQRLAVVDELSVRYNLTLGLRKSSIAGEPPSVGEVCDRLGIGDLVDLRAGRLRPSVQRLVMIGRALLRRPRLLILDEPTAAFSGPEVDRLFAILRDLREGGISVIFVSHRLEEVLSLCDRVVAMSQGAVIADRSAAGLTKAELADLVAGRHVEAISRATDRPAGVTEEGAPTGGRTAEVALRCRAVASAPKLSGIDFELRRGEMIGITGLVGSGRTSLMNALWGVGGAITAGSVEVGGEPFVPSTPRKAIERGIAYVPEHRARNSLFKNMTVTENVTMPGVRSYARRPLPLLDRRAERRRVKEMVEHLNLHPADAADRLIGTLSGGNQQKAIIARWLLLPVDVFLFDEPTEGVDVGGREDIYKTMRSLVDAGKSVLVSSSDVEEVVDQCSRVIVLREGTIAGVLEGAELTVDRTSRACIA